MLNTAESAPIVTPVDRKIRETGRGFRKLRKNLLQTSRRVCPPWLSNQAEDITQEVLMKLVNQSGGDTTGLVALPRAFLNRVTQHATVDQIRKNHRHLVVFRTNDEKKAPDQDDDCLDLLPRAPRNPEEEYLSVELIEQIKACFEHLNQTHQAAVNLYLQGYTLQEIGIQQKWSSEQTTNFVYRGLACLRQKLKQQGLGPNTHKPSRAASH